MYRIILPVGVQVRVCVCGNVFGRINSQLLVLIFFGAILTTLRLGSFPEPHNLEGFTPALLQSAPLPEAETLQGERDEPT